MTPQEFIRKWKPVALTERASAQAHFLDLCKLFGHLDPIEADPTGEAFAFEKGATKTGGGDGFADVWKRGFFAWEYKKKKRDLGAALEQLTRYASALDNPPLHVVCDTVRFRIETRWTNTVTAKYEFELEQLADPDKFALLRAVFHDPEALRPKQTRASLTKDAADKFQTISDRLQHRNPDKEAVAHFINQLVFCFFANSVKLLPEGLLLKLIQTSLKRPSRARDYFDKLFAEMENGGEFDLTEIKHFNGGLFDGRRALALEADELGLLQALHSFRWDLIDPTIFGTLFERFLDPDKRAQIGAHYTDPDKIMLIVEPVVMRPLRAEWEAVKAQIEKVMRPVLGEGARGLEKRFETARAKAELVRDQFIDRLCGLSILDPACGSGNFLYLALQAVKDLEYKVLLESEALLLRRALPRVGPRILRGIEINPLAAELARTVIWIGDIQWGIRNGLTHRPEPILEKLDTIECRDALIDWTQEPPAEAQWPEAEFIIGNPPFLGGKKLRGGLGDGTVETLFAVFDGKVPREADLVTYWFEKARHQIAAGQTKRAGLVSTNSIRGGANRKVVERLIADAPIFEAWADEPWILDGAAVRVSMVCFGARQQGEGLALDGLPVEAIHADLTALAADVGKARRLSENADVAFMGVTKSGPFDIAGEIARSWLSAPVNPNGRANAVVLQPSMNGRDITSRRSDRWIIHFPNQDQEADVSLFEAPYEYSLRHIKPVRLSSATKSNRSQWWRFERRRPELFAAIGPLQQYIGTSMVSKHRFFVFLDKAILPENLIIAIARDDDTSFGILHSRFHEAWSLRLGTWLGVGNDPRYTPTTTFETFPFPEGLTPNLPAAAYADDPRAIRIAAAAKLLDERRKTWLNPPDLVEIVPEIVPTAALGEQPRRYPDRILPKNAEAAAKLKERTLTNLYNQRPVWLAALHDELDRAVAAAYGWPEEISNEDALAKLLALNLERAAAGR
ncbi:MAG: class I SAM-dependent DNA methyltransferase [Stutzerimonas stutzeri]|nr:MAG: class I SAM-dependent DNA methyltransferase [Stutzerimonas stutzeri]